MHMCTPEITLTCTITYFANHTVELDFHQLWMQIHLHSWWHYSFPYSLQNCNVQVNVGKTVQKVSNQQKADFFQSTCDSLTVTSIYSCTSHTLVYFNHVWQLHTTESERRPKQPCCRKETAWCSVFCIHPMSPWFASSSDSSRLKQQQLCSCLELLYGEHFAKCTKFGQLILSKVITQSHILRL